MERFERPEFDRQPRDPIGTLFGIVQSKAWEAISNQHDSDVSSTVEPGASTDASWYKIDGDKLKVFVEGPAPDEQLNQPASGARNVVPVARGSSRQGYWLSFAYVPNTSFEDIVALATEATVHVRVPGEPATKFKIRPDHVGYLVPDHDDRDFDQAALFEVDVPPHQEQLEAAERWGRNIDRCRPQEVAAWSQDDGTDGDVEGNNVA